MARIVIMGLTITSSWGNGHATTWRSLVKALVRRGHEVVFFERDVPWYAENRDMPRPQHGRTILYDSLTDLEHRAATLLQDADAVMVGSFVPDGIEVGRRVLAMTEAPVVFYDIDTPVTLAKLDGGDWEYIDTDLVGAYDAYLSFTGGPVLERLEALGSPFATALYCSVDPEVHRPVRVPRRWRMGYLGTYSSDRQEPLRRLLMAPAEALTGETFAVAGPQYPQTVAWPGNVERIDHVSPGDHAAFYGAQDLTLNLTRADMKATGYAPSVRLFEAAACGVPVLSDRWPGLDTIFAIDSEILVADDTDEALAILRNLDAGRRTALARRARRAVLDRHTSACRAAELEAILDDTARRGRRRRRAA